MAMKLASWRDRLTQQEDLNFLLTNRVPRLALTRFMGWYSRLQSKQLTRLSVAIWRLFTDLDLSEAEPPEQGYRSLRDVFTRRLKPGRRPIDADEATLVSPCDGIVGAFGPVTRGMALQAKGMDYRIADLFGDANRAAPYLNGSYLTLRLTSAMYHRFHAPADLRIERVTHLAGDTWNVNPIALKRVERLFCRNVRAAIECRLPDGTPMALVPVAAILVASLRLHALDLTLRPDHPGPHRFDLRHDHRRGEEMGWFEQGSTIIVFLPPGVALLSALQPGQRVRMGEAIARLPSADGDE
ncbi:archaetidylserine decarboxylase [Roseateles amylovorans]|uniref:phosphatidylserine decarboxylase n=1 Tax=Roseateles amylovorans TaxID=2978473 RepID=A0ABY6B0L6_9BURK|nr:archaetidylserine decarboxylase [Roseateles amylovorans]UXH77721.1 archaetidylserine decarboxylase [Roseateles amylovorans]